jgi:hypothetical protein
MRSPEGKLGPYRENASFEYGMLPEKHSRNVSELYRR